jgi:hypothetical protein
LWKNRETIVPRYNRILSIGAYPDLLIETSVYHNKVPEVLRELDGGYFIRYQGSRFCSLCHRNSLYKPRAGRNILPPVSLVDYDISVTRIVDKLNTVHKK